MSIFGKPKQKLQPKMKDARINAEAIRNMLAMARGSQPQTNIEGADMSAADSVTLSADSETRPRNDLHSIMTSRGNDWGGIGGSGGFGGPLDDSRYRGRHDPMTEEMYRMMRFMMDDIKAMREEVAEIKEHLNTIDFYKE